MIDNNLMRCDDEFGGYNNIIKIVEKENKVHKKFNPMSLTWSQKLEDGLNFTAI